MKETQKIHDMVDNYLNNTTNGQELMEYHTLQDKGIWQMYGEDPDCHTPGQVPPDVLLVTVRGTLEQALKAAMGYPSFYTMGCGGKVCEIKIDISYHG
jgi:hypothetical protein